MLTLQTIAKALTEMVGEELNLSFKVEEVYINFGSKSKADNIIVNKNFGSTDTDTDTDTDYYYNDYVYQLFLPFELKQIREGKYNFKDLEETVRELRNRG